MVRIQNLDKCLQIGVCSNFVSLSLAIQQNLEKTTEYKIKFTTCNTSLVFQFCLRLSHKLLQKKAYSERNGSATILNFEG